MTHSSPWRRRHLFGFAAALLTLFAAPAHALPDAQVVISVTTNSTDMPAFDHVKVVRMPIGSQTSGSAYDLPPLLRGGVSTNTLVFGRNLPAGEYEINALRQTTRGKIVELNGDSRRIIGHFVVADGQSVDLGRLVATGVNDRVMVGRSRSVTDNRALLQRHEPGRWADFLAASKGAAPVRGWLQEPDVEDQAEAYAFERPLGFQRPTEGADGRMVAASHMGSVLVRGRKGGWSLLRSGRLESLHHALPVDTPDTALVAVGELGLILRQPAGDPELHVVDPGDLPQANLRFIAGGASTGWYVAVHQGKKMWIMKSARLEAGHWTTVREIDASPLFRDGASVVWLWRTAQGLAYALPRGPIARLDFATGQWTEHRTPLGYPMLAFEPGPNGRLIAATGSSVGIVGEQPQIHRSLDDGVTWQQLPAMPADFPKSRGTPRNMADGSIAVVTGGLEAKALQVSADGGASWQRRPLPSAGSRLHALPSGLLIAEAPISWLDLDVSTDGGQTWKNSEHGTFDLPTYKAQKDKAKAP